MLGLLTILFKSMTMFSGSYSNNAFPDPLTKEEEEKQIELLLNKDINARNILIEHNLRLVSHIAKKFITSDLLMLSVEERNKTLKNLERCMKQAAKAPKDIYVDAPEYLLGLVAKVPDSTKTGSTTNYGLKTFIQGAVNDFKFLEDAIKESNAVKY